MKVLVQSTSQLMNIEHGLDLFHSRLMEKIHEVRSSDPMRETMLKAYKEKLTEVRDQITECKKQISAE